MLLRACIACIDETFFHGAVMTWTRAPNHLLDTNTSSYPALRGASGLRCEDGAMEVLARTAGPVGRHSGRRSVHPLTSPRPEISEHCRGVRKRWAENAFSAGGGEDYSDRPGCVRRLAMPRSREAGWDVFVAHAGPDLPAAKSLSDALADRHQLRCYLDADQLREGDQWPVLLKTRPRPVEGHRSIGVEEQ